MFHFVQREAARYAFRSPKASISSVVHSALAYSTPQKQCNIHSPTRAPVAHIISMNALVLARPSSRLRPSHPPPPTTSARRTQPPRLARLIHLHRQHPVRRARSHGLPAQRPSISSPTHATTVTRSLSAIMARWRISCPCGSTIPCLQHCYSASHRIAPTLCFCPQPRM